MSTPDRQLPLHIGLRDGATFENFFAGPNAALLATMAREKEPFLYLWGAPGCGKSHLLQAACHALAQAGEPAAYLPLDQLEGAGPAVFEGLEQLALVCLDELNAVAGLPVWEEALFHLYNRVREAETRLIVAATQAPGSLGIRLPDLASRLSWGPVFQLQLLGDDEKIAALQLRARRRGMALGDEVAAYLLKRVPRDLTALFELLDRLDRASLAAQRRLTIPFVRAQLG